MFSHFFVPLLAKLNITKVPCIGLPVIKGPQYPQFFIVEDILWHNKDSFLILPELFFTFAVNFFKDEIYLQKQLLIISTWYHDYIEKFQLLNLIFIYPKVIKEKNWLKTKIIIVVFYIKFFDIEICSFLHQNVWGKRMRLIRRFLNPLLKCAEFLSFWIRFWNVPNWQVFESASEMCRIFRFLNPLLKCAELACFWIPFWNVPNFQVFESPSEMCRICRFFNPLLKCAEFSGFWIPFWNVSNLQVFESPSEMCRICRFLNPLLKCAEFAGFWIPFWNVRNLQVFESPSEMCGIWRWPSRGAAQSVRVGPSHWPALSFR